MDVAALSLKIDSNDVAAAAKDLDKFSASATKAEVASGKVAAASRQGQTAKMAQDYARAAEKADKFSGGAMRAAAANDAVAYSSGAAAAGLGRQAAANDAVAASAAIATTAAGRQAIANTAVATTAAESAVATRAAGGGMLATAGRASMLAVGLGSLVAIFATVVLGAVAFAGAFLNLRSEVGKTTDGLGLTEKQLDRLQKKGVDTGITLGDAFSGLGFAIGNALKDAFEGPLKGVAEWTEKAWNSITSFTSSALDTIIKVTIGSVAAIIAVWSDLPSAITDLFYQGVNGVIDGYNSIVQAGWSWYFAIIDTVEGIPGAMGDAFMGGVKLAGNALDVLLDWGKSAFAAFVYLWQNWPQILGDLFVKAVRAAFDAIVWLYEKSRDAIKALWNGGLALVTGNVGNVANPAVGASAAAADKAAAAYDNAGKAYDRFKEKFASDFRRGSLAARDARLEKAAGAAGSAPKGRHQYDFSDLLKDAQKQQDALVKASAQIGHYGEDLARITYETDLFNKASEHNLKLTPQQTEKIRALAAEMAKLSEQNRHSKFMENFNQQADQQVRSLEQARGAIGLTGAALAEYNYYQTAVNKALADHITLTDADRAVIAKRAREIGQQSYGNIVASAANDNDKSYRDVMRQLEAERGALGLTGAALESYNFMQQAINAQLQKGVEYKDIDVAALKKQADAYGLVRYAIDRQQQAIADAREVTKGFFTDWIDGVRNGTNVFKAFADAVINGLNSIIDKLLSNAFTDAFGGASGGGFFGGLVKLLGGGGGGLQSASLNLIAANPSIFANGGAFDRAQRFANGGTFTNSVVSSPTLFKFANGGKIGLMGEDGPEGILPLMRMSNGKLGVHAQGGGGKGVTNNTVNVQNDYHIEGAVTPEMIMAMIRQGGEATANEVKRRLGTWMQEYDRDGTVVT
jgi:hypothetical protein